MLENALQLGGALSLRDFWGVAGDLLTQRTELAIRGVAVPIQQLVDGAFATTGQLHSLPYDIAMGSAWCVVQPVGLAEKVLAEDTELADQPPFLFRLGTVVR